MNIKDDRDRSIDDMLRQSFRASGGGAASSSCPDAETLAAWADGSLSQAALATVETHLSDCSRCQRVVAVLAKLPASAATAESRWQWGVALRWLVPLTAGAAAIALWIAVPRREAPQSAVSSQQSAGDSRQAAVDSRQAVVEPQRAAPPETSARAKVDESAPQKERADASRDQLDALTINESPRAPAESAGKLVTGASPAARPAAPAAAAALQAEAASEARAEAFAPARQANVITQEVVSTTPTFRWRIGPRGLLQYSASSGASWEQLSTDVVADLVAGASPSSSVCWVVGRSGTVLLTVDGRRFSRVPFPAGVDLIAVRATDARTAVVTAADGRTFSTFDAGATWTQ